MGQERRDSAKRQISDMDLSGNEEGASEPLQKTPRLSQVCACTERAVISMSGSINHAGRAPTGDTG